MQFLADCLSNSIPLSAESSPKSSVHTQMCHHSSSHAQLGPICSIQLKPLPASIILPLRFISLRLPASHQHPDPNPATRSSSKPQSTGCCPQALPIPPARVPELTRAHSPLTAPPSTVGLPQVPNRPPCSLPRSCMQLHVSSSLRHSNSLLDMAIQKLLLRDSQILRRMTAGTPGQLSRLASVLSHQQKQLLTTCLLLWPANLQYTAHMPPPVTVGPPSRSKGMVLPQIAHMARPCQQPTGSSTAKGIMYRFAQLGPGRPARLSSSSRGVGPQMRHS